MAITKDGLNELWAAADGKHVFGNNGVFDALKKALEKSLGRANAECKIAPGRANARPFPERRRGDETSVPNLA
jgi:hypothetical protein